MVLQSLADHWICVITKCAETGRVPPASGVMVSAAAVPSGFRTVKTELISGEQWLRQLQCSLSLQPCSFEGYRSHA